MHCWNPTAPAGPHVSSRLVHVPLATLVHTSPSVPHATGVPSATPPGFVFAVQPLVTGPRDATADDVPVVYYLTVDGDFDVGGTGDDRVLCGASGLEYVALPAPAVMSFRAGRPAYAPPAPGLLEAGRDVVTEPSGDAAPAALAGLGTTAWCWFSAAVSPVYCAQPGYYGPVGTGGFSPFEELATATLASLDAAPAFPMIGHAWLDEAEKRLARAMEAQAIAPERRRQIALLLHDAPPPVARTATASPGGGILVSPLGLAIRGYDADPWDWVAIGNTLASAAGLPDLRFTKVGGPFRAALSTSSLFMVLGSASAVMACASVPYQLTRRSLGLIRAGGRVRQGVCDKVDTELYPTETAFDAMLRSAGSNDEEVRVFQRYGGLLTPVLSGFQLRMSPRNWEADLGLGLRSARLIFKLVTGRSLRALVEDTAAWAWPAASSHDGKASTARDDVRRILAAAADAAAKAKAEGKASPYDHFLLVVDDPRWTGVLALSVEAPLDGLPEPLQPLAAGIDPARFHAHHLGFSTTSFTVTADGKLRADVTPTFGLIDYEDRIDQYFSSDTTFAFRVLKLTAGFQNGELSSFATTAELMVNRLFGTPTRLFPTSRGNNIVLDGLHQRQRAGGATRETYVLSMRDAGVFQLLQGQLAGVRLSETQLVTVKAARPAENDCFLTAAFQMKGKLRFAEPEGFDPFCWGPPATPGAVPAIVADPAAQLAGGHGLSFSNYAVTMRFSLAQPSSVTFAVSDENLGLDAANSPARPNSLYARFPLLLTSLLTTPDPAVTGAPPSTFDPKAAGFASISAPLQQGRLTQPWYGLVYEVDLGTLGALAASAPIKVRLLVAWSPGSGDEGPPAVYIGASLPGVARALGASLSLQGVLDIGFRTLEMPRPYTDAEGRRQYLARLRDFGLRVMGMSFPPARNDITLFGSPTSNTKLGWYAAYDSSAGGGTGAAARAPSSEAGRQIRAARRRGAS
jgi:hypothetical protein